jgi:hypothetical protein
MGQGQFGQQFGQQFGHMGPPPIPQAYGQQQQMMMGKVGPPLGKGDGKGKGPPMPKPEKPKEDWEIEEEMMFVQIEDVIKSVAHLETEWDPDEFNKKIGGWLRKSGKAAVGSNWQLLVDTFVEKFYTLIGTTCYDRKWLEIADWALPVASAVKAYGMEPHQAASAQPDEYFGYVSQRCGMGQDQCRYDANAHDIVKSVIPNKVAQKKVRDAVDTAREAVVKQMQPNPEAFITAWVQEATQLLAKESFRNNPTASMVKGDAERLYEELVQNCGVPMWLEAISGKLPRGNTAVKEAVALAYQGHQELAPRPPKGFGQDKDPWGGMWGPY